MMWKVTIIFNIITIDDIILIIIKIFLKLGNKKNKTKWNHFKTQNLKIYNINEVMIQTHKYKFFHEWINKLFSEENQVRTLFEARKVAGSAIYKQSKTEWNCVVL